MGAGLGERVSSMNSKKSKELLEKDFVPDLISEQHLADRFFAGSVDTYLALRNAYSKRALPHEIAGPFAD